MNKKKWRANFCRRHLSFACCNSRCLRSFVSNIKPFINITVQDIHIETDRVCLINTEETSDVSYIKIYEDGCRIKRDSRLTWQTTFDAVEMPGSEPGSGENTQKLLQA